MEPGNRRPKLSVRVDPAFKDRVRQVAEDRFHGSEAMVLRDALETYVQMRDHFGVDFDRRVTEMLKPELAMAS